MGDGWGTVAQRSAGARDGRRGGRRSGTESARGPSLGVSFRLFGLLALGLVGASAPAVFGAASVFAGPLDAAPAPLTPASIGRSAVVNALSRVAGHQVATAVVGAILTAVALIVLVRIVLYAPWTTHRRAVLAGAAARLSGPFSPAGLAPRLAYARRPPPPPTGIVSRTGAPGSTAVGWLPADAWSGGRDQQAIGAEVVVTTVTGSVGRALVAGRPRTVRSPNGRLRAGESYRLIGGNGDVLLVGPIRPGSPPRRQG